MPSLFNLKLIRLESQLLKACSFLKRKWRGWIWRKWELGEDLGRMKGEEPVIKMYCMREDSISNKKKLHHTSFSLIYVNFPV